MEVTGWINVECAGMNQWGSPTRQWTLESGIRDAKELHIGAFPLRVPPSAIDAKSSFWFWMRRFAVAWTNTVGGYLLIQRKGDWYK